MVLIVLIPAHSRALSSEEKSVPTLLKFVDGDLKFKQLNSLEVSLFHNKSYCGEIRKFRP